MKKIAIDIQDLLLVLESLANEGTRQIILFEKNDVLAIADVEEPDNIITFQTYDEEAETKDGDKIH